MKRFIILTRVVLAVFIALTAMEKSQAATPPDGNHAKPVVSGLLRFTENKRQWNDAVVFRSDVRGGTVFLEKGGFTYALVNGDDASQIHPPKKPIPPGGLPIRMHALMVRFENALAPQSVTGSEPESSYSNYFVGNDPSRWASNVKSYSNVYYKKLYAGVDMKVYSNYSSLKYDFIVASGADAAQIKLRYDGADGLKLVDGNLNITTSVGKLVEEKPYACQVINGKEVKVECRYVLNANMLSFEFPSGYDKNLELVIDPTLIFSTLTGSTADNWGNTATYDDFGNFYTGGIAAANGYPTTPGAYQLLFGGGGIGGNSYPFDISITKYNPTGTARIYSTYLGGSDNEQPNSMVVNANGELFVLGRTYSLNYPVTAGAYQPAMRGGADIVLTHFNATGTALVGSTYLGGTGDDGVNIDANFYNMSSLKYSYSDDARSDIFIDASDNVYVANCSRSVNFPVANAFQPAFGGGTQDGVVFSMNGGLTNLRWSSYLGGTGDDGAYAVILDKAGNVLVAGGTASPNFPSTAGSYKPAFGGTIDGFIAKIANNGSSILNCTFLGTPQYDQCFLIQADKYDNIYVVGQTQGIYPISAGVYNNPNSSQFIHKLSNDLSTSIFSTVFGNGVLIPNMALTAFLVDICENLYVSGWGRGPCGSLPVGSYPSANLLGMPIANALQPNTNRGCGFYFIQLSRDAISLLYGSYFGGTTVNSEEHVDGGTSRFDKNGTVYQSVCAACGGQQNYPTTAGVVSTTNNSFNCNNGGIKMHFDFNMTRAIFNAPPFNKGCAPFTANFANNSVLGVDYQWDFGDGDTSTLATPSHLYYTAGTYSVTLIAHNPATCNQYDTTHSIVTVFPPAVAQAGPDQAICIGSQTTLSASGGSSYSWTPSATLVGDTLPNPIASPIITTDYIVSITDTNGCPGTDTVLVTVNALPPADAGPDVAICAGADTMLNASGGINYTWMPDTTLSSLVIPNPIANPSSSTSYIVTVTDTNNCQLNDTVTVSINPSPIVTLSPDTAICLGDSSQIIAAGGTIYAWTPIAGLSDPTISNPIANPVITTPYSVIVTDSNGCVNNGMTTVTVNPLPVVTVSPPASICDGSTTLITSTGGTTYSWNPIAGLTNPNDSATLASPLTTTGYTVTVTDGNNCVNTGSTTITVNPPPVALASPPASICIDFNTQLTASGGIIYSWIPATGLTNPNDSITTASPAVTTTYTVIVTDANNCIDSAVTSVTVNPPPVVTVSPDTAICFGGSTMITAAGGSNFTWSPALGLSDPTIYNPTANPSATTTYSVMVTDTNGCVNNGALTVTVNTITINVSPDASICNGGQGTQLNAFGGGTYIWTPPTGLDDPTIGDPVANPTTTTTYTVDVTTVDGCKGSGTVTVVVKPAPIALAGPDQDICVGETVQLGASGGFYYSWMPPTGLSNAGIPNPIASPQVTTDYAVVVSLNSNCPPATDTVRIVVHPIPPVFAGTDTTIMAGYNVTLTATGGGISYQWSPSTWLSCVDCASPVVTPLRTITYIVNTIDAYGCRNQDTIVINVEDMLTLYVPNAFTPHNADAANNMFYAYGMGIWEFEFYIFDRWGAVIFESKDVNVGWNGTYKGNYVQEDVYVYLAKATSRTGKSISKTGSVTVIK